jgi:hypothetical protein
MGTGRIFGSIAIFVSIVALATWSGCGSSNSQGVSFRSLGFFTDATGTTGESGTCASLRDTTVIPPPSPTGGLEGGFLGLQNSMVSQGINVDRVNLSYFVNGSSLAIPNDVFALSLRLGPANGAESNGSTAFSQIVIVSPQIMKFINDNSNRLPDLPFTLVASASAVGTADDGEDFTTNRSTFQVVFTALSGGCTEPTPTPGESSQGESGTGTGG